MDSACRAARASCWWSSWSRLVATAVVGRLYYVRQRDDIIASKGVELSTVRDLKIEQIQQWREGLLKDGQTLAKDPTLRDEIERWIANPDDAGRGRRAPSWMSTHAQHPRILRCHSDHPGRKSLDIHHSRLQRLTPQTSHR